MTNTPQEYAVRREQGCTFIFGAIPVADFVRLTRSGYSDGVIDMRLGRLARATCAFGSRDACRALYPYYEAQERARVLAEYPSLDPAAQEWLITGDQGASSATLFFHFTGVRPYIVRCDSTLASAPPATAPRDSEDFARCQRLLELVPAFAARLPEARTLSPIWARLVGAWPALVEMLDSEAQDWRTAEQWRAPRTSELLAALRAGS